MQIWRIRGGTPLWISRRPWQPPLTGGAPRGAGRVGAHPGPGCHPERARGSNRGKARGQRRQRGGREIQSPNYRWAKRAVLVRLRLRLGWWWRKCGITTAKTQLLGQPEFGGWLEWVAGVARVGAARPGIVNQRAGGGK